MKYQTLSSAGCYAGLANLLDEFGIDVEDRDILLAANIPYMLSYEPDRRSFLAGAMLQGAQWFDLYLRPQGLRFSEKTIHKDKMLEFLWGTQRRAMLAVQVADGGKHALVFEGVQGDNFRFLNTKWQKSPTPERYIYPAAQLLECLDEQNIVGCLERCEAKKPDFVFLFDETSYCADLYYECLLKFFSEPRQPYELADAREPMLRALFKDMYAMAELSGEARLMLLIKAFRTAFNEMEEKELPVIPSEELPMTVLKDTFDRYKEIVFLRSKLMAKNTSSD